MSDMDDVIKTVESFFEAGRTKDLASLQDIQLDDPRFSSFSDVPPFGLQDFKSSIMLEELRFVSISDYDYEIIAPKISMFGDAAVAAFGLVQKGMLVDTKTYTGEHLRIDGRATFVLVRKDVGGWKIVHIHLSKAGDG